MYSSGRGVKTIKIISFINLTQKLQQITKTLNPIFFRNSFAERFNVIFLKLANTILKTLNHHWFLHQHTKLFHGISLRKMLLIYENSFRILQPRITVLITFFLRLTTDKLIPSHCFSDPQPPFESLINKLTHRKDKQQERILSKEKSKALKLFSRYHCF